jgi:DNA polymerase III subunit delta
MVILLHGEDTFRSRQKLNEIIKEYQAKHKTGLNLVRLSEKDLSFDKIKEILEAVSMFNEKKLVILENALKNKGFLEDFSKYVKNNKLKGNQEIILVIYQEGKLAISPFKSWLTMSEEFKTLAGPSLNSWVKKKAAENQVVIDSRAIDKLVAFVGSDLWQMSNEIGKLASYKKGQTINSEDIDLMVKSKIDLNIFKTLDALAQKDKKTALKLLHEHLNQGENEIFLFSRFVYQLRVLLKLKDLMDKGVPYYNLAKQSGLHPFVVKKSSEQLRNFTLEQLKEIYRYLLKIDLAIKTGRLDGQTALDLLVNEM